ncbi:MAG: hypothetical protein DRQ88_03245 [Epsilonproteobacteria bacterium]|nr:MAG: hypothetical protein DRQ89_01515 [Campylobacterota bacterium]RLA67335.1 MAG: hypothetical protein DRQ88_03245 [Campylobacterota bacterium]
MLRLLLILFLFIPSAHSYYNDWGLKGALGMNYQSIAGEDESSDNIVGLTVNTQFGYRWDQFELDLASYVTFGKSHNIHFKVGDELQAIVSGMVRTVNFVPLLKFYTHWVPIQKRNLYFSAGPSFSLRTFWTNNYTVLTGELDEGYKITYHDTGIFAAVGIEELSTFKEENPSYFEILFGYTKSRKITVVDASNNQKVRVVHSDEAGPNIRTIILMFNLGITFF